MTTTRALVMPMLEAHVAGRLPVPEIDDPPAGARRLAEAIADVAPVPVTPAFAAMSLSWWSWLHGAVALELNGQFHWMEPEGATDDLFEVTMESGMHGLRQPG